MAAAGILYPLAGIPSDGNFSQHNLAWELARDRRFDPLHGDIDAAFKEFSGHPGRVVISSEDFESILLRPEVWAPFVSRATELGFRVAFVVYARPVAEQLESVYLEILRAGLNVDFSSFSREVMETGKYECSEWVFCFDVAAIARSMATVGNSSLVFRNYANLVGGSTISDFGALLGARKPLFDAERRTNMRSIPLEAILTFLVKRAPELLTADRSLAAFLNDMSAGRSLKFVVPLRLRAALQARFPGLDSGQPDVAIKPGLTNMARVFSFETQVMLTEAFRLRQRDGDVLPDGPGAAKSEVIVAKWWDWVSDVS